MDREKAVELYKSGATVKGIAKETGYSCTLIYKELKKCGINVVADQHRYPALQLWLEKNRMSQSQLAAALDLSNNTISRLMDGVNGSKATIDKVLAYTGLTYEELFAEK